MNNFNNLKDVVETFKKHAYNICKTWQNELLQELKTTKYHAYRKY